MNPLETFVVVLTPTGRAALASVLVVGPQATSLVARYFHARRPSLDQQPLERILYGRWADAASGEEVIVARRGADRIEVHCHGGHAAVRAIVENLVAAGARELDWRAWMQMEDEDAIKAEARLALADATTERTAAILWDQHEGALRRAVDDLHMILLGEQNDKAIARVDELLAWAPLGLHATRPWRVAFIGLPNAGKSSLVNALLGYARAIVHETPGTTRDLVQSVTAIEGWPVELVDTAGWRSTNDPLEAEGIALSAAQLSAADSVVLVHDWTQAWNAEEDDLVRQRPEAIVVYNKADLMPANSPPAGCVAASALTGQGVEQVQQQIAARLVGQVPTSGEAIPFTARQVALLEAARGELQGGRATQAERLLADL